ncbi:glycosyltransferase [Bacillus gobiensis]|uniref:glycosyltransferase n=1 Tax=Bacillus gobiensis TaxID=1441095 RepID=UPI003D21FB2A
MKISICTPAYNAEKNIPQLLDSIVSQTMDPNEFEVIVVDDKSTDNTIRVLKQYRKKIKKLRIYRRFINSGGPGKPRNQAMKRARGEYIFFADADDYLGKESLQRMYDYAIKHSSEVLIGKYKGVNGRGVPKSMFKKNTPDVDPASEDARLVYTFTPQKLFKRSLIKKHKLRFLTNVKASEDQYFYMKALIYANKISVLADYDYYYLVKHEGDHASASSMTAKEKYYITGMIANEINIGIKEEHRKKLLMAEFINRHFDYSRMTRFTISKKTEAEKQEWMNELRKFVLRYVSPQVDELVYPHVRIRLLFIRNNDYKNLHLFEKEEKQLDGNCYAANGNIYADLESLKDYSVDKSLMMMNYKNKIHHFAETIQVVDNQFSIKGTLKYSLLKSVQNAKLRMTGVFVHRATKKEKVFKPLSCENNYFSFKIAYTQLIEENEDFGVWDFFIDTEIEGFHGRSRLGSKKNPYKYPRDTFSINHSSQSSFSAKIYFTHPLRNVSIDIKRIEKVEVSKCVRQSDYLQFILENKIFYFSEDSNILLKTDNKTFALPFSIEHDFLNINTILSIYISNLAEISSELERSASFYLENNDLTIINRKGEALSLNTLRPFVANNN